MPTIQELAYLLDPQAQARTRANDSRRAMAQALIEQGWNPGNSAGGGLLSAGKSIAGALMARDADAQGERLSQQQAERFQQMLGMGGGGTQVASNDPSIGVGTGAPSGLQQLQEALDPNIGLRRQQIQAQAQERTDRAAREQQQFNYTQERDKLEREMRQSLAAQLQQFQAGQNDLNRGNAVNVAQTRAGGQGQGAKPILRTVTGDNGQVWAIPRDGSAPIQMMMPDGSPLIDVQGPTGRGAVSQAMQEGRTAAGPTQTQIRSAKDKLISLNSISNQLDRVTDAMGAMEKGTWLQGYIGGQAPGSLSAPADVFDKATALLAAQIRSLTRTPGEGSMSDYESRLAQMTLPSRTNTPEGRAEAMTGIRALVGELKARYGEYLGGGQQPSATPPGPEPGGLTPEERAELDQLRKELGSGR